MSVAELLSSIEMSLVRAKLENEKLSRGVKSSAPKVRAALLEIGKYVSESRKVVLDIGKSLPVKHRVPKEAEPEQPQEVPKEAEPMAPAPADPIIPPAPKKRAAKKPIASVPA